MSLVSYQTALPRDEEKEWEELRNKQGLNAPLFHTRTKCYQIPRSAGMSLVPRNMYKGVCATRFNHGLSEPFLQTLFQIR